METKTTIKPLSWSLNLDNTVFMESQVCSVKTETTFDKGEFDDVVIYNKEAFEETFGKSTAEPANERINIEKRILTASKIEEDGHYGIHCECPFRESFDIFYWNSKEERDAAFEKLDKSLKKGEKNSCSF